MRKKHNCTYTVGCLSIFIFIIGMFCISCKRGDSNLRVSNGVVVGNAEYPAVIRLYSTTYDIAKTKPSKDDIIASCTGSIVSNNTVITAAHCTDNGMKFFYGVIPNGSEQVAYNVQSKNFNKKFAGAVHDKNISLDKIQYDVAIWVFEDGSFQNIEDKLQLSDVDPQVGLDVMLIGYGCYTKIDTKTGSYGGYQFITQDKVCDREKKSEKRKGFNTIASFPTNSNIIYLSNSGGDQQVDSLNSNPTGEGSLSDSGDSGGPLLLKDDTRKILGICSAGSEKVRAKILNEEDWRNYMMNSYYANPLIHDNQRFLESVVDTTNAVIPGIQVGVGVVEYNGKIKVLYKDTNTSFNEKISKGKIIKSFNDKSYSSFDSLKQAWRSIDFYSRSSVSWSFE